MNIDFTPSQTEFSYNHLYLPEYPMKGFMRDPINLNGATTGSSNFPSMFDSPRTFDFGANDIKTSRTFAKKRYHKNH